MSTNRISATLVAATAWLSSGGAAAELKVGDPAPAFSLIGSDGVTYSLEQYRGAQGVVLAWFPKAATPG
jgi:peroxiredoxin Q/BCP